MEGEIKLGICGQEEVLCSDEGDKGGNLGECAKGEVEGNWEGCVRGKRKRTGDGEGEDK